MSELEKILKNVLLGSVGAVATAVEKTGDLAKSFVAKGGEVVEQNKGLTDKGREIADSAKASIKKLMDRISLGIRGVDRLSKEQREELRTRLNELDEVEAEMQREMDARLEEARAAEEAKAEAEKQLEEMEKKADAAAANAAGFFARLTGAVGRAVESANDAISRLLDINLDEEEAEAPAPETPEAPEAPETPEALEAAEAPEAPAPEVPEAEKAPEDPLLAEIRARLDEFARRIEANRRAVQGDHDEDGEG